MHPDHNEDHSETNETNETSETDETDIREPQLNTTKSRDKRYQPVADGSVEQPMPCCSGPSSVLTMVVKLSANY